MIPNYTDGRNILAPKYRKFRPSRTRQLRDAQAVLREVSRQLYSAGHAEASNMVRGMAARVEHAQDRILGLKQ